LHLLLQRGFEVHVIDLVERGRSGFAPDFFEGEPIMRSMSEAWSLFRIGSKENFAKKQAFENQRFPVSHLTEFSKSFVPRWLTTSSLQVNALTALLKKLEKSTIICHSQGGEIAFDAACNASKYVENILAIEPSNIASDITKLNDIPITLVQGDYLSCDEIWSNRKEEWKGFISNLTDQGNKTSLIDLPLALGEGNSHFPMLDSNNEICLDLGIEAF